VTVVKPRCGATRLIRLPFNPAGRTLEKPVTVAAPTRTALLLLLSLAACSDTAKAPGSSEAKQAAAPTPSGDVVRLQGAGASFPAPLYLKWFKSYSASHPGVEVDYQSVGSGSGVKSFIDKTVDFGASDAAMNAEEIARVPGGVQLAPATAGSIVLAYNLEGVKDLKLSRAGYSGIFLGAIKKWNDPTIAKANPGVALPDAPINVVVRADSSGTTFVFSKHLSAISPEFARSPGTDKMPNWPVGTRSKGNEGVTASLKTTPGSIGYIEYGYAKSQNLPFAALENKSGQFVTASTASGQAALASTSLPDDLIAWASDPEGKDAYPIVTYTWLLFYKKYDDGKKLAALKDLLGYGLGEGQKEAEPLGYIPLPEPVTARVKTAVASLQGK
jgi:phosphate transport system substrate-binding protein